MRRRALSGGRRAGVWLAALAAAAPGCAGESQTTEERHPSFVDPHGWTSTGIASEAPPFVMGNAAATLLFARANGRIDAFARAGGDFARLAALEILPTDAPATAVLFGGEVHVFVTGSADGGIHHAFGVGPAFGGWSRVTDLTTDTATIAMPFSGSLYLFAKGADDHVVRWSKSSDGREWDTWSTRDDQTRVAPAAAVVGDLLAYFTVAEADGEVHVAFSRDGEVWSDGGIACGAAPNVAGLSATTFGADLYLTVTDATTGRASACVTHALAEKVWGRWFELTPVAASGSVGAAASEAQLRWFARGDMDGLVYETSTPVYQLPFADGAGWSLINGNFDDPRHGHVAAGDYSFDFAHVEDGTEVRAMREGRVVLVEADEICSFFHDWECVDADHCCRDIDQSCQFDGEPRLGNVVMIQHGDGTVASYNHLAPGSVPAALRACGALVRRNDVVGRVGHTGVVCGPSHVHVGVISSWSNANGECRWGGEGYPDKSGIDTSQPGVPIYFSDRAHAAWRPVTGDAFDPWP